MTLCLCNAAHAQAPPVHTFWDRLTLDVGYELSYVRGLAAPFVYWRNPESGREVAALLYVRYRSASHGLGFDAAFSLKPWVGVGLDCHLQQDFTAPTHPWFESLGIRYGRRRAVSFGAFAEFRPWQRHYQPRRGLFFRVGGREMWFERELTRTAEVISASNGHGGDIQGWLGGGYRLAIASAVSVHLLVDAAVGIDNFEGRLRLGGGFQ